MQQGCDIEPRSVVCGESVEMYREIFKLSLFIMMGLIQSRVIRYEKIKSMFST